MVTARSPRVPRMHYDWQAIEAAVLLLAEELRKKATPGHVRVYGVPRGGCLPAVLVARHLGLPMTINPSPTDTIVVDDLIDSGATLGPYVEAGYLCGALYRKESSPTLGAAVGAVAKDAWLVMPWEIGSEDHGPEENVRRLLQHIGEDPTREGLLDTPKRVVKALTEMTAGYLLDPAQVLGTTFGDTCDEMIVVSPIEFTSTCEHHLLPFTGTATVGYVPGDRVVGLSKLPRLVDLFAHRLQIQERMTNQIADAIEEHLRPRGVGVILSAHHTCMSCRGVRKQGTQMTTSALRGYMKDDPKARAEFLAFR